MLARQRLVVIEGLDDLVAYGSIPIAFEVRSRLDLGALALGRFAEESVEPYLKDYDSYESEGPAALASRFDITNWGVFAAFENQRRVGGAIVARNTPEFDMLRGRDDLCVMVDLRVHPNARGKGIGKRLFEVAVGWAREEDCREMIVETQDTNVAACRFYSAMGCELESVDPNGYGPEISEAKLIWKLHL